MVIITNRDYIIHVYRSSWLPAARHPDPAGHGIDETLTHLTAGSTDDKS